MKTSIKNLFAAILTVAISASAPAFVNAHEAKQVTVVGEVKKFNKLNVPGNVSLSKNLNWFWITAVRA